MNKISKIFLNVFAVGALLTLFAGALALVGFIAAFVIGGETATQLCVFIHKTYFLYVIRVCSVAVGIGLIGMYLGKMKALSVGKAKESK